MQAEVGAPSVQNSHHAQLRAYPAWGLVDGIPAGFKEQAVHHFRVVQAQWVEGIRQGEHQMEAMHGGQLPATCLYPLLPLPGLAVGAVAVAAGVIGGLYLPAAGTCSLVGAECGSRRLP